MITAKRGAVNKTYRGLYNEYQGSSIKASFRRSIMSTIKGIRTRHAVTMNHIKANPDEQLYIGIPILKPDNCLVPSSLH